MTPHHPSRIELIGCLLAVAAAINPQVASRVAVGFENGLEPRLEELADDLGITLEQLIARFADKVFEETGAEIIAAVQSTPRLMQ